MKRYFIQDNRKDGRWVWNGKRFVPRETEEAKGYKTKKAAHAAARRAAANCFILGSCEVLSITWDGERSVVEKVMA